MLGGQGEFGAQCVNRVEIVAQHCLRRPREGKLERLGADEGIAVAVAADPGAGAQEARRPPPQRPLPSRIERRQYGKEYVAQIGQSGVDLVGDIEPLAAQRPGLPKERDTGEYRLLDQLAVGGFGAAGVPLAHQLGDAVPVIDHALAPHFGGMGGQHRHDQRALEKGGDGVVLYAVRAQRGERLGEAGARLLRSALAVFGEIGEHREQHEAADEGEGVVEAERTQAEVAAPRIEPPVAVDGSGADRLDAVEQLLPAVAADHVAEQRAEKMNVGVLADRPAAAARGGGLFVHLDTPVAQRWFPLVRGRERRFHQTCREGRLSVSRKR
jgi:hypothetical protein